MTDRKIFLNKLTNDIIEKSEGTENIIDALKKNDLWRVYLALDSYIKNELTEDNSEGFPADFIAEILDINEQTLLDAIPSDTIPDCLFMLHNFKDNKLTIPSKIKYIGLVSFSGKGLENITLSKNLIALNNASFCGCESLISINLPNSLTKIPYKTFYNCYKLSDIKISDSVNYIGNTVFQGCTSLETIDIPNSVIHIGSYVFKDCTKLNHINISDNLDYLGEHVFENCSSLNSIGYKGNNKTIIESLRYYADIIDSDTGEVLYKKY